MTSSDTLCLDHVRPQLPTYKHEGSNASQTQAPVIEKPITKAPVTRETEQTITVSRTLMATPEIKQVAELPEHPRSMIRRQDDTYYITYESKRLTQVDSTGSIINHKCSVNIMDIAVPPSTDQMYCVYPERTDVRLLDPTGQTKRLFGIDIPPRSIAVTSDDKILIGLNDYMINLVHVYSLLGDLLQTIDCAGEAQHIAVCTSTHKIAIACRYGGAMVLDGRFKQLYTTKGFTWDVEFDNHGHLLALNNQDRCVYVLNSETGERLQTIYSELFKGYIKCVVTQTNGDIYVCTGRSELTPMSRSALFSIKYLQ